MVFTRDVEVNEMKFSAFNFSIFEKVSLYRDHVNGRVGIRLESLRYRFNFSESLSTLVASILDSQTHEIKVLDSGFRFFDRRLCHYMSGY